MKSALIRDSAQIARQLTIPTSCFERLFRLFSCSTKIDELRAHKSGDSASLSTTQSHSLRFGAHRLKIRFRKARAAGANARRSWSGVSSWRAGDRPSRTKRLTRPWESPSR